MATGTIICSKCGEESPASSIHCVACGARLASVMGHDVFISYSSHDKVVADSMCATLESRKIRCWIAPRDMPPGKPWPVALIEAIGKSRVFVLILSDGSNDSPQVIREVREAMDKGIPAIPFRIDNIEPSKEMGYYIKGVHWLDAMTPPLEKHLHILADTIQGLLSVRMVETQSVGNPPVESVEATASKKPSYQPLQKIGVNLPILLAFVFCVLVLGVVGIYLVNSGIIKLLGSYAPTQNPTPALVSLTEPVNPSVQIQDVIVTGKWFSILSADYSTGEIVLRFNNPNDPEHVWDRAFIVADGLCVVTAPEDGVCKCLDENNQLTNQIISGEDGFLKFDPYEIRLDTIQNTFTVKTSKQINDCLSIWLASVSTHERAIILLCAEDNINIVYETVEY